MDFGHEDLARLERMADGRELHLLAFVDFPDPMALASTDTWHVHVFRSIADECRWIGEAEVDGTLSDDMDHDMRQTVDVRDVLDEPGPILDITFH